MVIAIIYDSEEFADSLCIIEEYIQGETLYEHISYVGTMSVNELIHFDISLCQPIKYLCNQENSIDHSDLQPGNLILKENTVNLIDFDHALLKSDKPVFAADCNKTIAYAAFEQFLRPEAGKETDIYAIGVLLYYAGTENKADLNNLHIKEGMNFLKYIILNCLSFDKNPRYTHVEEVKKELRKLLVSKNTQPSYNIAIAALSKSGRVSNAVLHFRAYLRISKISEVYKECNSLGHILKPYYGIGAKKMCMAILAFTSCL